MKLIDVLRNTVRPALAGRETKVIGSKIYVMLDDVRRIEITIKTAGSQGNYEIILMKLVSKTNGELDRQGLYFRDLIGVGKLVRDDCSGGYRWFRAETSDIEKICRSVADYIEMWA